MRFAISFMNLPLVKTYDDYSTMAAKGLIVLGDSSEEFLANLGDWSQEDYQSQWRDSIHSLVDGGNKAVLITTYSSPVIASHLEWWALYREGEDIFVQNQLLFFEGIEDRFRPSQAVQFLKERETENEEGVSISEWKISMGDLRDFATQLAI